MATVPLPQWVQEIRPSQQAAVDEAVEAYKTHKVVMIDGPTGTGKTLIAELIRRELRKQALYVCSDKSLQDQFARDFPYAKVLKGRANYPTETRPDLTADDCTSKGPGDGCWWCVDFFRCPYQKAKAAALASDLAVTNTSFLLSEANFVGKFSGRELVIADEADTLEGMLMGFVEYSVSEKRIAHFGMELPGKGIRKPTMVAWLDAFAGKIAEERKEVGKKQSDSAAKELRRLTALLEDTVRVRGEFQKEIDKTGEDESTGRWLRDYGDRNGALVLKPVMVDSYGTRKLWRHGKRWLLMSATLISADEMADSLGLPLDYHVVTVPMTFPVGNRPIIMAPVADVVYKNMAVAIEQLAHAISVVLDKHPGESILVHTVSYKLASDLAFRVKGTEAGRRRMVLTYSEGREREATLAKYKANRGAVMFAPSMSRGIDLPGDLCRVQVVAKVPFLSLGDAQVARRTHLPGGDLWYAVQAIRDMVQMTGRAVRSVDDHATTYIFDRQFASNLWRKRKGLFPQWWRDAVITDRSVREFMS